MIAALRTAPWAVKLSLAVILVYVAAAILAPAIAPFTESEIVTVMPFGPWGGENLLGTDQLGRDVFSRLIYGARNTLGLAFATVALAFALGGTLGVAAAIHGGWVDQLLSRTVDILMSIPSLIFCLIALSVFGSSALTLILVLGVLDATRVFRLARASALGVVATEFVEAARLRGDNLPNLLFGEILPNIRDLMLAEFGLRFTFIFLSISALSFLGLGLPPPSADWGSMVREGAELITFGDITPLIPAGAIALLAISVNLVVDWYQNLKDMKP